MNITKFINEHASVFFDKYPFVAKVILDNSDICLYDKDNVNLHCTNFGDPRIAEMVDLGYEPTPDQGKNFKVIERKRQAAYNDEFVKSLSGFLDTGLDPIINPNPSRDYVEIIPVDLLFKIPEFEGQEPQLENCYVIEVNILFKNGAQSKDTVACTFDLDAAKDIIDNRCSPTDYGWDASTMEMIMFRVVYVNHENETVSAPLHQVGWVASSPN